jgi:hypothetical protein
MYGIHERRNWLLICALLIALGGVLVSPAPVLAEGSRPDIRGEWAGYACDGETLPECEAHPEAPQNFVIETEDFSTGAVTGKGPGYTIKGSVSGHTFTVETLVGGVTSSAGSQTISEDVKKLAGTFKAGSGTGATFSTRLTPSPTEEAEAEAIAKSKKAHASATSVSCYVPLLAPGAAWECTATVADASGNQPPGTPTGSVSFTINAGITGGFVGSSSCPLKKSESGPTSYCTVLFVPTVGVPVGAPSPITAHYSGDQSFAPSASSPQSFVAQKEEQVITTCRASSARVTFVSLVSKLATVAEKTISVGDAKRGRHQRALTRKAADRRAVALLHPSRAPLAKGVALYGLTRPLPAGAVVTEANLGLGKQIVLPLKLKEGAWLFWEDLSPLDRYGHPSVVLVISAHGGRVLAHSKFGTYPEIDGHPAPFMNAKGSKKLALFSRSPSQRHPRRLTKPQVLALARARTEASSALKVGRKNHNALVADVAHSSVFMLVDHKSEATGDTFENEEAAIGSTFAKHGVTPQGVPSVEALSSAVQDAVGRGQTNITVFVDGHGLPAPDNRLSEFVGSSALPTVMLGAPKVEGDGKLSFPNGVVTSADLTAIVKAHPEVQFNFIIDSCFSGRFVDPLKAQANVGAVLTSASSTETSWSPMVLERTGEKASGVEPGVRGITIKGVASPTKKTGDLITPSGEYLLPHKDTSDEGLSPFTTGVIAAVNQAFVGKDASADVTAVLSDARTLEPTYDLAATAGQTKPSPEPTPTKPETCSAPLPAEGSSGGWFTGTAGL